jgi:hypothetical protein
MVDARGGFRSGTSEPVPLRAGSASFVVRTDGTATVGQWGRDVGPGVDVMSVRQNLDLAVDQGRPVLGLDANGSGRWGSEKNQLQYTWRSGVGVDAAGNVIYVGGNHLTLTTLGTALVEAGVVRGMELDIHTNKVDYFTYTHPSDAGPSAHRLLPDMPGRDDRYLVRDLRDFFVATLR